MKRVLEPSEGINGEVAREYMKFAKWRISTYCVVAYDVYEKLRDFPPERILEVACAGGLLTNELHKLFPLAKIIGMDISEEMIRLAKKEFDCIPEIDFHVASVYSLPYRDDFFDLTVCQGSVHHFYDPERALKEMVRVTKHGKWVYIQDLRRDVPEEKIQEKLNSMKDEYQKERELISIRASLSRNEIENLMKGLDIKRFWFKPAEFSEENLNYNRKIREESVFDEIGYMKDLEYILWIEK